MVLVESFPCDSVHVRLVSRLAGAAGEWEDLRMAMNPSKGGPMGPDRKTDKGKQPQKSAPPGGKPANAPRKPQQPGQRSPGK